MRSIGGRKKYLKVPTDMSEEIDFDRFQGIVDASEFVIFLDSYGGFARDVSKSSPTRSTRTLRSSLTAPWARRGG